MKVHLVLLPLEEETLQEKLYKKVEPGDIVYLLQLEGLIKQGWKGGGYAVSRGEIFRGHRDPGIMVTTGDQDTQVTAALRQQIQDIEVKRFGIRGVEYQTPTLGFDFFAHTESSARLEEIISLARREGELTLISTLSGQVLDYVQSLMAGTSAVGWWNNQSSEQE